MSIKVYTILIFLVLWCNNAAGQPQQAYIDSVDHYRQHVDSLIHSFYADLSPKLHRILVHHNCANDEMGGSAELYEDNQRRLVYGFTYLSMCDDIHDERAYYFIGNKIVLAQMNVIPGEGEKAKYYKDDRLLWEDGAWLNEPTAGDTDLLRGYEILKDFRQIKTIN